MMWLFSEHILSWWLIEEERGILYIMLSIFDFIGAAGFLFVAGISTSISYNNRKIKAQTSEDYNEKMLRNEYLLRVFLIFIIAMSYNIVFCFWYNDMSDIWRWYILLTITFSLLFAWPLLKTSKMLRIIIGICVLIINMYLIEFLSPHEGRLNSYGILFYILYHQLNDNYILGFFTFFLIGTVFGDIIYEIIQIDNREERLSLIKKKMILPSLIVGPILITLGVLFKFPDFYLMRASLSWAIYMLGLDIIIITTFVSIEEFEIIKTQKSYKFLFYFSYYSLTLYIFHSPMALLFYRQLSLSYIWIYIVISIILVGLLMRFIHKRIEGKYTILNWQITFSIKVQVSRMSQNIVRKRANKLKKSQI